MGFGCLFVGYFFANMMPPVGTPLSLAKLIGYPLMIAAFYRLAPYHKRFLHCFIASFATLPFAVYYGLLGLAEFKVMPQLWFLTGTFYTVVESCYLAVSALIHVLMLLAIFALTKELQHADLQGNALRCLICTGLYTVLRGLMLIPCAMQKYLFAATMLLWLCMLFMNLFLLFRCYRYICPEGDENMPEPLRIKRRVEEIEPAEEGEQDGE